jgi:hypothetical protein
MIAAYFDNSDGFTWSKFAFLVLVCSEEFIEVFAIIKSFLAANLSHNLVKTEKK